MNFGERVDLLMKQRGSNWYLVSKFLKMGNGQLQRWKEGNYPNGQTIIKLCEYFGVSADYLLFGKESGKTVSNNNVGDGSVLAVDSTVQVSYTPQEQELIALYRKAPLMKQVQAIQILSEV